MNHQQKVYFEDWGRIDYAKAWDDQKTIHASLSELKLNNRGKAIEDQIIPQHRLIFCEHNPVFTLGKSGSEENVLLSEQELQDKGISYFAINRGGDITYHGPGQIVVYPILDLDYFFTDVHKYVRYLEEAVILTLAEYGLKGFRIQGYTGVWLENSKRGKLAKICAIGVHLSRWITMHGLAFNINTDLHYFNYIIPCGIVDQEKTVTSMSVELGMKIDQQEVKTQLKNHFCELFGMQLI